MRGERVHAPEWAGRQMRRLCETSAMTIEISPPAGFEPPDRPGTQFEALVAVLYADLRGIARRERFRARAGPLCAPPLWSTKRG